MTHRVWHSDSCPENKAPGGADTNVASVWNEADTIVASVWPTHALKERTWRSATDSQRHPQEQTVLAAPDTKQHHTQDMP